MATLVSTVINRCLLPFRYKDPVDVLTGTLTSTAVSVPFTFDFRVAESSIVEIDSELMLVTSWDSANKTATVKRAILGTTAATHSSGATVYPNPRFLRRDVLDYINMAIVDMYPRLFDLGEKDLVYDSVAIGYDLASGMGKVVAVSAEFDSTAGLWEYVYDWQVVTVPTSVFASGRALMFRVSMPEAAKIHVVYAKPFVRLTTESQDLEATAGLESYMVDLPYYYAMSRLLASAEVDRAQVDTAESHQRAQDTPGFLALRTGEWYKARYDDLMAVCLQRQRDEVTHMIGVAGYGR
jgi:hypothetical protein